MGRRWWGKSSWGGGGNWKKKKRRNRDKPGRYSRYNHGVDLDFSLFNLSHLTQHPHASTSGFSYMNAPPPIHEMVNEMEEDEMDTEMQFGMIRGNIVGIQYYHGTVNNGEMVALEREPQNKYDCNAVKIKNVDGVQVGHIKRELARALACLMDNKLARVEGIVPFGSTNVYSMPVDLSFWGQRENKAIAISKMSSFGFYIKQTVEMKPPPSRPNAASNLMAGFNSSLDTRRVYLSPAEVKGELDKLFENLKEGDKSTMAEPADAIVTKMYPHQKQALHWMIGRENNNSLPPFWQPRGAKFFNSVTVFTIDQRPNSVCGGILADDMGLGKTLEMIALIMTNFEDGKPLAVPVHGNVREPKSKMKKCKSAPVCKSETPGFQPSKNKVDVRKKMKLKASATVPGGNMSMADPPGVRIRLRIKKVESVLEDEEEGKMVSDEDINEEKEMTADSLCEDAMLKKEDAEYVPKVVIRETVVGAPSPNMRSLPRRSTRRPAKYRLSDSEGEDENVCEQPVKIKKTETGSVPTKKAPAKRSAKGRGKGQIMCAASVEIRETVAKTAPVNTEVAVAPITASPSVVPSMCQTTPKLDGVKTSFPSGIMQTVGTDGTVQTSLQTILPSGEVMTRVPSVGIQTITPSGKISLNASSPARKTILPLYNPPSVTVPELPTVKTSAIVSVSLPENVVSTASVLSCVGPVAFSTTCTTPVGTVRTLASVSMTESLLSVLPEAPVTVPVRSDLSMGGPVAFPVRSGLSTPHLTGGDLPDLPSLDMSPGKPTTPIFCPDMPTDTEDALPDLPCLDVEDQAKIKEGMSRCGTGSGRTSSNGPRGTLIICPLSVLSNWLDQLDDHLHENIVLEVYLYYGSNRITDPEFLKKQDIVLTTYSTIAMDTKGKHPLKKVSWLRLVLDEGHAIRNPKAQQTKAIMELNAKRKWVLTGTPIQNSMKDLWSIVNFLDVSPFTEHYWWHRTIERPLSLGESCALKRVQHLMGAIALRRTKSQEIDGKPLVQLPAREVFVEHVKLGDDERKAYDAMQNSGQLIICKYFNQGTLLHHYGEVLAILMRLRQLCCHPQLVAKAATAFAQVMETAPKGTTEDALKKRLVETLLMVLQSGSDEECSICLDSLNKAVITPCAHVYCRNCIEAVIKNEQPTSKCPLCRGDLKQDQLVEVPPETEVKEQTFAATDADWQSSAKVDALMNGLLKLRQEDPTVKSIVVSQFTSLLRLLEIPLRKQGFTFTKLDGTMSAGKRREAMEEFSVPGADSPSIMLLSLKAGGVGINLVAASRVFLMDPAWNPASEEQCFDRCHRLGQTRDVIITKFVIEDSVEERMLELQEKKRQLMQGAFDKKQNADQRREQRINDIRNLINL